MYIDRREAIFAVFMDAFSKRPDIVAIRKEAEDRLRSKGLCIKCGGKGEYECPVLLIKEKCEECNK